MQHWSRSDELLHAVNIGSTKRTLALLSDAGPIDIDEGPFPLLMVAATNGHPGVASILLDKGANVSVRGDIGTTALHGSA